MKGQDKNKLASNIGRIWTANDGNTVVFTNYDDDLYVRQLADEFNEKLVTSDGLQSYDQVYVSDRGEYICPGFLEYRRRLVLRQLLLLA